MTQFDAAIEEYCHRLISCDALFLFGLTVRFEFTCWQTYAYDYVWSLNSSCSGEHQKHGKTEVVLHTALECCCGFWSQLPSIPVSQVLPPEASFLAPIQL